MCIVVDNIVLIFQTFWLKETKMGWRDGGKDRQWATRHDISHVGESIKIKTQQIDEKLTIDKQYLSVVSKKNFLKSNKCIPPR
jgi:hypothetical protein